MDLQERLQAVQAEHQDITQQIAEADARIAEAQRAYEEAQGHYLNGRANAQLQVRFLEGQMALLSEMMQSEALKQTQEPLPTADEALAILERAWTDAVAVGEHVEKTLPMLNGTQENNQPN